VPCKTELDATKIDLQTSTGAVACQLLDAMQQGSVSIAKVLFQRRGSLQNALDPCNAFFKITALFRDIYLSFLDSLLAYITFMFPLLSVSSSAG
jgi:hypothetical protein